MSVCDAGEVLRGLDNTRWLQGKKFDRFTFPQCNFYCCFVALFFVTLMFQYLSEDRCNNAMQFQTRMVNGRVEQYQLPLLLAISRSGIVVLSLQPDKCEFLFWCWFHFVDFINDFTAIPKRFARRKNSSPLNHLSLDINYEDESKVFKIGYF